MGMLSKLFGSAGAPEFATFDFDDQHVGILKYHMFGQFTYSLSRRYFLVWRDSNSHFNTDSSCTSSGRVMLFEGERVLCDLQLKRPHDGKVADSGVFIINDWDSDKDGLGGTFCAYHSDGSTIVRQSYKANLYNNGLSLDGRWAACQTCNSPDHLDGSVLTIFDLSASKERSRWSAECGWPDGYEFSEDGGKLFLVVRDLGSFTYSLDGEFLDRQAWLDAGIACGHVSIAMKILAQTGDAATSDVLHRIIVGLDTASKYPRNGDPRNQAQILTLMGQCHDKLSDWTAALKCYDAALALNSNVSVKRRATQIRKVIKKDIVAE